jgi:hypothetical protein
MSSKLQSTPIGSRRSDDDRLQHTFFFDSPKARLQLRTAATNARRIRSGVAHCLPLNEKQGALTE